MADKTIPELEEIVVADGNSSFLVIDNGTQTYKIKPVNIPGLPRSVIVDLVVTSALTGYSLLEARGYAYADKTGQWKLNFNLAFTKSTAVEGGILAFAGLTFRDVVNQSLYISTLDGVPASSYTVADTNEIEFVIDSTSLVGIQISGDVEIDGEPEWYEGSGSGGDGFDPEPGAVNSVNGQIGDVVLTTSEIAEGARLYFTDSRARGAVVDGNITSGVTTKATSQDALFAALALKQSTSQKNSPNGYAGLDGSGKILLAQLPSSILGSLIYRGALDASAGAYPSSPAAGDYWVISVAGTISGIPYAVKDWAVYNGTSWDKVSGAAVSVTSVNGLDGEVELDSDAIPEGTTNQYFTTARARGAAVEDAIADAVTTIAPSQNAVFDALAAKESLANKGAANGYPPLDSGSLIPEEFLPDVAGGLAPVAVTSTGTSVNNTIEEITLPGSTITRTLPDLPGPSDDPLAILFVDKAGTCSSTIKITLAPFSGKKFERAAAINDTISMDYPGSWMLITAAPGATTYTIQTQANTLIPPAADGIGGYVTPDAQVISGPKTFKDNTTFGNGASISLTLVNNGYITTNTSDAADNKSLTVSGGGGGSSWNQNRGAGIVMNGNEVSGAEGELVYYAGNSGGSFGRHRWVVAGVNVGNIGQDKVWTLGDGALGASQSVLQLLKANATSNRLIAGIDAATRGYIRINGAQTNLEFEAASDRRIKKEVKTLEGALSKILSIKPVTFKMKDTGNSDAGFIAQEFAEVFPEAVTKTDEGLGKVMPKGVEPWSMSQGGLTVYLVRAIQELHERLEALEGKVK